MSYNCAPPPTVKESPLMTFPEPLSVNWPLLYVMLLRWCVHMESEPGELERPR